MKVYIVVGTHISSASIFSSISKFGVKSDLESAKKELDLIEKEIIESCKENETEIIEHIKYDDYSLRFVYGNDDEECYNIEEREVDYNA